ncbi:MAG TPA: PAS domain-containing protein [Nitrospira sp.]|nr:PAS domain-containing protein [Nitrospira sp.]
MANQTRFSSDLRAIRPYGIALALSLAALAVRLSLTPLLHLDVPFLTFLGAVMLSAWIGGTGPALFALAVSAILANYCCVPPYNALSFDQLGIASTLLFMLEAAGLVWLMAALRRRATLLQASQAKFELFTQAITDAYVVVDAKWIYTEINDKAESILGSPKEAFLGRNLWDCFPDDVGSTVWHEMHRAMASRSRLQFEHYSHRFQRWFESRVYPYADGLTVLFTDITDRKDAEAAARDAEEQLQLVSNTIPALISYADTNARFVTCNDAYTKWFGLSKSEVIGKTMAEVLGDEAWERLRPYVEEALTGHHVEYELEVPYRQGPPRWIHAVYTPHHHSDGRLAGFVAMITNITEQKVTERALRESEERFRLATAAGDVGIWDWDIVANRVSWSDTIYRIHGLKPGEFPGTVEAFAALVHPDDLKALEEGIRQALNELTSYDMEFRALRPDGSLVWISTKAQVMRDANGAPCRMLGASVDISDRKAAEAAIRDSEARMHLAQQAAQWGVFEYNYTTGANYWSPELEALYGLSQGTFEGTYDGWIRRIHPEDRAMAERAFHGALETDECAQDFRVLWPDGSVHWLFARARVFRDSAGRPERMLGVNVDVSARKAAEEALRVSEQHFREMADAAPAMLWVTDELHETIFVSRGWREYTKQENDAALGFGWTEAVHPEDRTTATERFLDAAARRESFALQYRLRRHDDEYRWVLDAGRPRFTADGRWVGYIGSVIDIHERIQAEEQLRGFASQLENLVEERTHELVQSHERLRTLATELNLAELRERKRLATDLHDYLQQMLVLAKLKLGHSRHQEPHGISPSLLNELDNLLSDALKYTRSLVADLSPPALRDHGLAAGLRWLGEYMTKYDLRVTIPTAEQQTSAIPEEQSALIFQCVRELLINTSKHARTQHAQVSIDEQDGWLSVVVSDQGAGFDPRALRSATTDGGTVSSKFGLLSIQERMRALGGGFEICSTPGEGTTATLRLPLMAIGAGRSISAAAVTDLRSSTQEAIMDVRARRGAIRVLLVDDHAMVRQGLRTLLGDYRDLTVVGEAANGDEAIDSAESLQPDIVVMDINMPGRTGIEATAEIKKRHAHIQVIGLSVNTTLETQKAMHEAGAVMVLTKEAVVENLYKAIHDVWRRGRPDPIACST